MYLNAFALRAARSFSSPTLKQAMSLGQRITRSLHVTAKADSKPKLWNCTTAGISGLWNSNAISMNSATGNIIHSRNFFTRNQVKRMEVQANANPQDSHIQASFLRELNKANSGDVVSRFESGMYASNDEAKKEYLKALVKLNKLDQLSVQSILSALSHSASGHSASSSTPHGVAENGTAVPQPNQFPFINQSQPLKVIIQSNTSDRVWMAFRALLLLSIPVGIYFLFEWVAAEEKKPLHIPIASAHSQIKNVDIKFDDVKGVEEAKEELKEIVEYLKNPQRFTRLGAKLPKGVLLVGEPGTGKTLLARAIAGEAGVPFLYCSGSSFDELFVGVGPRRVRDLFEEAKKLSPCIIFIDELDAVGGSRKDSPFGSSAKESTLNQLLTELDGFKPTQGIIIIGATNLPETLDSALTRPGRFDKKVVVPIPDLRGRKEIIDLYFKKTIIGPDVDSSLLARATIGFSGAELSNLVNLAAIKATMQNKKYVDMRTIEEAKDDITMGIRRKGFVTTDKEKRMTAYHEGGHALVSMLMDGSHPVHKATIISRGSALGVTMYLPEQDQVSTSRKQMHARLATAMGGRAAEEIIFGEDEVTSGASSDLRQATQLAEAMVTKWGMSDRVGTVYRDLKKDKLSDQELNLIDAEVKLLLQDSYEHAKHLLKNHENELHLLATALVEYETLSGEEIKQVIAGKKLPKRGLTKVHTSYQTNPSLDPTATMD